MAVKTGAMITFEGHEYFGAEKIGFTEDGHFVVDLHTTPPPKPQGGYFTCLPISPLNYRQTVRKTKAAVRDDGDSIVVFDDWGGGHRIAAERELLDLLIDECEENEIPLLTPNAEIKGAR
jgi:hypothetical protein